MQEYTVKFTPQDKTVRVPKGTDLLSAAIKAGIVLAASCGGEGLCGKCKVIVENGKFKSEASRLIGEADRKKGMVLACETIVEGDLEVRIPKESTGMHEKITGSSEEFTKGSVIEKEKKVKHLPLVRKVYVELAKPTADDNTSDLERLYGALADKIDHIHIAAKVASLKHLDELLRDSDYKVTAVLVFGSGRVDILTIEPGDTSNSNFGFAFDIGTTTVVGQLVDLNTRNILGTRIAFNKQASYGSDVITRIIYASEPQGLEKLNQIVLENINEMIADLAGSCKVNLSDIYSMVIAGNMTMMHLLLKIDPSNIRKAPYIPTSVVFENMNAAELEIEINPKGIVAFAPGVTTYIGGDIVSGVLACGLADRDDMSLLADIGTNGEIVLGTKDWMIGAAASAGPAFEGSGLSHGMKAVRGAIEKVKINKNLDVEIGTIGGDSPKGICGSGYIDLLCQMLKAGVMGKDGKIDRDIRSKRIRKTEANYEFVVVFKKDSAIDSDIVIQDDDIENLKRSKAAIYSAIIALLNKVEKNIDEVKKIYIAGGFGNYLNIENSIFIGLLPDLKRDVYEFIGNSSLAGARISLVSREGFEEMDGIYKNITYVDLSAEPNYMDEYIAALFFPHTDLGEVPIGTVIAVNGKGGTGKTTIASLLVAHLVSMKKGSVLAIDADPNSCLAENLGIRNAATIVGICEEVSKNMDKIPSGMTKDRFIEMRVQEALIEAEGFDLLVMGRPEGPGCYCYVNNLLRNIIGKLTAGYDFVVIDNAAGMEHISRRTMREMSKLLLVSDYSIPGVRSAKRIHDLAKELGIKITGAYLVVNKVSGAMDALEDEVINTGLMDAGSMLYNEELVKWNISNRSIFEFKDKAVWSKIKEIFNTITK